MINNPTALLQPGDHKAETNWTPTAAGDKVWAGVAESFGLGAEPCAWTGSPSGCETCVQAALLYKTRGVRRNEGPKTEKFKFQSN